MYIIYFFCQRYSYGNDHNIYIFQITLYLYNWPQDLILAVSNLLTKQMAFHIQRSCLLNNIVLQKLGIFHGLTPFRVEKVSVKQGRSSVS